HLRITRNKMRIRRWAVAEPQEGKLIRYHIRIRDSDLQLAPVLRDNPRAKLVPEAPGQRNDAIRLQGAWEIDKLQIVNTKLRRIQGDIQSQETNTTFEFERHIPVGFRLPGITSLI